MNQAPGMLSKRAIISIAIASLLTVLILNRLALLSSRVARDNSIVVESAELVYIPNTTLMRLMTLGYDQAGADFLWLRTLGYFGRHFIADRRYVWLEHLLERIIELDPRFRRVYHWAGTNVLYGRRFTNQNVMRSNRFYELALARFPDDAEAAFRLGINYYVELKTSDPEQRDAWLAQGAQYLEMAANMPGAQPSLKLLVSSIYSKLGQAQLAVQYATEQYLNEEEPAKKKLHRERLEELKANLDIDVIEAAHEAFEEARKAHFDYLRPDLFIALGEPAGPRVAEIDWRDLIEDYGLEGDGAVP